MIAQQSCHVAASHESLKLHKLKRKTPVSVEAGVFLSLKLLRLAPLNDDRGMASRWNVVLLQTWVLQGV